MARIVFLCPFGRDQITGGIKNAYRQAELLTEAGFDAWLYQPEGKPAWFESSARVLTDSRFAPRPGDVLVFPETLNGWLAELAQSDLAAKKVLYCQAHYYALFNSIAPERMAQLGFAAVACQSRIAQGFLQRVLHFRDVAVVPCFIDRNLFRPREKRMQIAFIPSKLPREAAAIHRIFHLKFPQLAAAVTWVQIDKRSERETAEIFGNSAIVLSLPFLESFGLVPLEAMACGAVVAGFHGYGGQEYATAENGIWLRPDHLEEAADAIAELIRKLMRGDPEITHMREAGFATIARYSRDSACAALAGFYGPIVR